MNQRRPKTGETFPMPTPAEKAKQISTMRQMARQMRDVLLVPNSARKLQAFVKSSVIPSPSESEEGGPPTWDGLLWWFNALRHHDAHQIDSSLYDEFLLVDRIFQLASKYKFQVPSPKEVADKKAEIEERGAAIELICDRLQDLCCPESLPTKAVQHPPAMQTEPKDYLTSWAEILQALGMKAKDKTSKAKVRALHDKYESPIVFGAQGSQPIVERAKLLKWWDSIESKYHELEAKSRDAAATVESQYLYGRESAVVVTEVNGAEKKRRRTRKAT